MICVVAVWGRKFSDTFLKYVLPSHLAIGNIPCLTSADQYIIYTDKNTFLYLKNKPIVKYLSSKINVLWKISSKKRLSWNDMTEFHKNALIESAKINKGCVFLGPDFLISENTIKKIKELDEQNIKLVLAPGIRTNLNKMSKKINGFINHYKLKITNRKLSYLVANNLHAITKSQFTHSKKFTLWPSAVLQKDKKSKNIAVQSFHIHPIYVKLSGPLNVEGIDSIDGILLEKFNNCRNKIYLIKNSDEMLLAELSEANKTLAEPSYQNVFNKHLLNNFCLQHTYPIHRWIFKNQYILLQNNKNTIAKKLELSYLFCILIPINKIKNFIIQTIMRFVIILSQLISIYLKTKNVHNNKNKSLAKTTRAYGNIHAYKNAVSMPFKLILMKKVNGFFPDKTMIGMNISNISENNPLLFLNKRKTNLIYKFGESNKIRLYLKTIVSQKKHVQKISLISTPYQKNSLLSPKFLQLSFILFKNILFNEIIFYFKKPCVSKSTLSYILKYFDDSIIGLKVVLY